MGVDSQNGPFGKLHTYFNHSILAQKLLRIPFDNLFLEPKHILGEIYPTKVSTLYHLVGMYVYFLEPASFLEPSLKNKV